MRQSKFKEAKIVEILRGGEKAEVDVATICHKHGISEGIFYRWKKTYDGTTPDQLSRLKKLERDNNRMRKLIVDRDLEIEVMKEVLKKF